MHHDDRGAVIAALLQELARLLKIGLDQQVAVALLVGRAAHQRRIADPVDLGIAHLGAQKVLLGDRIHRRLPGLQVVERRVKVVEAHDDLAALGVPAVELDVLVGLQQREQIGHRNLDQVDLALGEGIDCRTRVGDREPFEAVDLHHLAAGQHRGRLGARLVLCVLDVDDLLAGLPLVLLEDERAGAGVVVDLLERVGLGDLLGHHEGHGGGRLAQRVEDEAERLLEDDLEGLGIDRLHRADRRHHLLAEGVAGAPALDRGDAVLGGDGRPVMPFEAVAQREGPGQLVGRGLVLVDHLRLDARIGILGEQGVIDHVAVVSGDEGGRPDRVQDLQIGMGDHLQGLRRRRGRNRRRGRRQGQTGRDLSQSPHNVHGYPFPSPAPNFTQAATSRTRNKAMSMPTAS